METKIFRRLFSFATHNGWCRWSITSQNDTTAAFLSVIVRLESSALYATFEYLGAVEKKVSDSGLGNLLGILNSYVPQPMLRPPLHPQNLFLYAPLFIMTVQVKE